MQASPNTFDRSDKTAAPGSAPEEIVLRRTKDGALVERATLAGGRLHGPLTLYHPDGLLRREARYRNGLADGLATDYDRTGAKLAETTWVAGQRHGPARTFVNGAPHATFSFVRDKLEGVMTCLDAAGATVATIAFRDGVRDGAMRVLGPDGALLQRAHFVAGQQDGWTESFGLDGGLLRRTFYRAGQPVEPQAAAETGTKDRAGPGPLAFYEHLSVRGPSDPGPTT